VVVRLLLGEPQDLLHAGAEAGERGPTVLLDLLVLIGQLLLEAGEALLGLAQPALRVVHALLGLRAHLLRLGQCGGEALEMVVYLLAVVAAQRHGEVVGSGCVVEKREIRVLLLGHWHILADP
jgi:hypothetical protein